MEENPKQSNQKLKFPNKLKVNKTALLVFGLIILTSVLLAISLYSKGPYPIPSVTRTAQEDFAQTTLALSEEVRPSSVSGVYEMDVNIDSGGNEVTGVQLELSFDPKMLTGVDIKPGGFLSDPVVILKKIDTGGGRITYMLGNQLGEAGVKGQGVIATLSFSKTGNGETFIDFLPQTLVGSEETDVSVLKETTSGMIGNITSEN